MDFLSIFIIAVLIMTVVDIFKPMWNKDAKQLTATEFISMGLGVLVAIFAKLNLLSEFVSTDSAALLYIFYVLTGIAIGRGPSFLYDLWLKLKSGYGNGL